MRGPEQEITKVFVVSSRKARAAGHYTMRTTTTGCRRRSSRSDGRAAILALVKQMVGLEKPRLADGKDLNA
jgi:hypothetical protein